MQGIGSLARRLNGYRRGAEIPHGFSCSPIRLILLVAFLAAGLTPPVPAFADEAAWTALRSGGHVALLRHALAPGSGDPPEFSLEDCATQRNLSDKGREQAERIGDTFRAKGIETARVLTSQWCRCLDTAERLALGPVEPLPLLNSFFRDAGRGAEQTRATQAWIATQSLDKPTVLVTHQVNITALVGIYPRSGELVVAKPDEAGHLTLVGRIPIR